jgi:hypothetical protein
VDRKPNHPTDHAAIRARKLHAMATLALAIKSELDALNAATPLGHDYVFRISVADLGRDGLHPSLTLAALERTPRTESGLIMIEGEVLPLSKIPARKGPPRVIGGLVGDVVKYLPILFRDLEKTGVLSASSGESFALKYWTAKSSRRFTSYKVSLREVLPQLNRAVLLLVEQQGLGYSLNEGWDDLINAYVAVLAHNARSSPRELVLNWTVFIRNFRRRTDASAFPAAELLATHDAQRKKAGEKAERLELLSLISTRRVLLAPKGIQHFRACEAAAAAGLPLPSPFA